MNDMVTKDLPEVAQQQPITPMQMLSMAVSQGADLEKLTKLMDLQERWEKNEARKAYHRAFSEFKAEAVDVVRNKLVTDGPLKGKSYAELNAVVDTVTPALSRHGLSASWRISKDEKDWLEVTCTITHELGHSESVSMGAGPDVGGAKNSIQARASTVTYLERYTLMAATGLAAKNQDDDGNAVGKVGLTPSQFADFKAGIEGVADQEALTELWQKISTACFLAKDEPAFAELQMLTKERSKTFKKVKAA